MWELQETKERCKKGRALGGIVMGIRRELIEEEMKIETSRERQVVGRVKWGERWRIIGVYMRKEELERMLGKLERWAEEREEGVLTSVGGDFNVRIGTEGGAVEQIQDWRKRDEEERRSKDLKVLIYKEGKMLIGFLEEKDERYLMERRQEMKKENVSSQEEGESL